MIGELVLKKGRGRIDHEEFLFSFCILGFLRDGQQMGSALHASSSRRDLHDGRASTVVSGLYWNVLSSTRVRRVREQAIIRRTLEGCFVYGFVCPRRSQRSTSRDFGDFIFTFFLHANRLRKGHRDR